MIDTKLPRSDFSPSSKRIGRLSRFLGGSSLCVLLWGCTVGTGPGPGPASGGGPAREPVWIAGQVVGIDNTPIDEYNESTVQLVVTTEGEHKVRVKLAPGWFLDQRGLTFHPEQRVEFHGVPDAQDQDLILAQEIRSGATSVQLRDESGTARWPNRAANPASPNPTDGDAGATPAQPPPSE